MFDSYQPPEKTPPDYTGLKIVGILAPVFFVFAYFDKPDIGLSVCIVLGMTLLAIRLRWELRKHVWFWIVIAIVFLLHIPLFLILHWPQGKTPTIAYTMPLGIVDFAVILGAVGIAERVFSND